MTLILQTADGNAVDANAYITAAEFTAYHQARGNPFSGT